MSKFTNGFIVGVGIGVLFAPLSGQEMRQLIGERVQKLRASGTSTVAHLQAPPAPAHTNQTVQNTTTSAALPGSAPANGQTSTVSTQNSQSSQNTTTIVPTEAIPTPASIESAQVAEQDVSPVSTTQTPTDEDERTVTLPSPIHFRNQNTSTDTTQLDSIPGMTPELQHTFAQAGITTQQQLLQQTPTKEAASDLAHSIGTSVRTMRHVVTCADLLRIPGVDSNTAALLEQAGVTSCQDLQQRNPEHLHEKLVETQAQQNTAAHVPDLGQVETMVATASTIVSTNQA